MEYPLASHETADAGLALATLLDFAASLWPPASARAAGHLLISAAGAVTRSDNCLGPAVETDDDITALLVSGPRGTDVERVGRAALLAQATRLANAFSHLGLRAGDGVGLHLEARREALVTALACRMLDAAVVPLAVTARDAALAAMLHARGCRFVVTSDAAETGTDGWIKEHLDRALLLPEARRVETVLVCQGSGHVATMRPPRDRWFDVMLDGQAVTLERAGA